MNKAATVINKIKMPKETKTSIKVKPENFLKIKSIKKGIKTTECKNCGNLMRWKIRN